jgi:hypothetical protein
VLLIQSSVDKQLIITVGEYFKMVQSEDFKIELVYADTKMPFKEHTKDGKIFVEVEPDAEYFIKMQPTGTSRGGTAVKTISVDGTDLGYKHRSKKCKDQPSYKGIRSRENGVSTAKALKFTKPLLSQDGTNVTRGLIMGKVEVRMYEGILDGYTTRHKDFTSTFTAAAVDLNQSGLAKKKSLRSGEGEITVTKEKSRKPRARYKCGAHFDTITLNYCTALGLMEVGVLKKPDVWTHHRMKRPAKVDQGAPRVRPKHIHDTGATSSKTVEICDLCEAGSDDES